ncbi:hypothetical protein ACJJTC_002633 [Scirpophaga incertulas]
MYLGLNHQASSLWHRIEDSPGLLLLKSRGDARSQTYLYSDVTNDIYREVRVVVAVTTGRELDPGPKTQSLCNPGPYKETLSFSAATTGREPDPGLKTQSLCNPGPY